MTKALKICKTEKEQQDVENLFSRFVTDYNSKSLSLQKLSSLRFHLVHYKEKAV